MITGNYELRKGLFGRLVLWVEDENTIDDDPYDRRVFKYWRKALKYEKDSIVKVLNKKGCL